jgi:hypothetical protein
MSQEMSQEETSRSVAQPLGGDGGQTATFTSGAPRRRYIVARQQDAWFIMFDGDEFGPYQSDREALLLAIDAAHKLAAQGEETQVLRVDEGGDATTAWTHGIDPYPPRS